MIESRRYNLNRLRAKVFAALSDPIRLQIIEILHGGEKCVCEITPHFGVAQPLISRHLKILKDSGVVRDRKAGNRRLYSVTNLGIFDVIHIVSPELVKDLSRHIIEQVA